MNLVFYSEKQRQFAAINELIGVILSLITGSLVKHLLHHQSEVQPAKYWNLRYHHHHYMMITASSQLDMISCSSPFGRCIPNHPFVATRIGHNSSDYTDLWVHHPQRQASSDTKTNHNSNSNSNDDERNYNENNDHGARRGDKWARAREMVFSSEDSTGKSSDISPTSSVEIPCLVGVSSLVQKWRCFEVDAKCSSRRNPNSIVVPAPAPSVSNEEDSIGDWESDRTAVSGPPSSRGRDSDATENERLRVADIIRKLTDDRITCDSLSYVRTSSDQSEQRCFSPVINSPRMIRGRQAFQDLFLQMERDRNNELRALEACKAVSKYSHGGRIQALLRVRFLRRGLEARECRQSNGEPADPKRLAQPAIFLIRERFNSSVRSCREVDDATSVTENVPTSNQEEIENIKEEVVLSRSMSRLGTDNSMDQQSSITSKEYSFDHGSHEARENVQENSPQLFGTEHLPLSESCKESNHGFLAMKPEEVTNLQVTDANYNESLEDSAYSQGEECGSPHLAGSEVSHPEVGWEEGKSTDWICEVSRPRGDWEDFRKARYQEMLDPFSKNEEIRSLLQRGTVSSFLSSSLREQIDKVMLSRSQGQLTLISNQTHEEEQFPLEKTRDKDSELVISEEVEAEDEVKVVQDEERDEFGIYYDEYDETESSIQQQYNDYLDTTSTPPPSWPQHGRHDVSHYSYPVASSSTYQSLSSTPYSQDHNPSSTLHSANEMDLLYDLKGHMDQLHQEISELRRSIKCCMSMQMKLQSSIKQEVAITSSHPGDKNGQRNPGSRGRCYICYKRQVDSLLYRCGHMCTCLKCAQELQQGGGKCPICRAPIVDIVRPDLHF
ncbi:uncharacterized protein LOC142556725 [Primulina tabacum]|uniref:uncharacterized protein LOC142556725 n=1 Tax=Primulina tabacum TaxID=48773 RepID=UPI003F5ABBA0